MPPGREDRTCVPLPQRIGAGPARTPLAHTLDRSSSLIAILHIFPFPIPNFTFYTTDKMAALSEGYKPTSVQVGEINFGIIR